MEYRGHILIIFALSLMASPWAIKTVLEKHEEANIPIPERLVTDAQARANCDAQSVETIIGRVGCDSYRETSVVRRIDETMITDNPNRRVQGSGAMFISAPRQ